MHLFPLFLSFFLFCQFPVYFLFHFVYFLSFFLSHIVSFLVSLISLSVSLFFLSIIPLSAPSTLVGLASSGPVTKSSCYFCLGLA